MTPIPFVALDDPRYGQVAKVSPLIRRLVARNPSKFTYHGTGTYIVGHGDVAVIDPGPDLTEHRDALAAALSGEQVRAIVVTHCHSDHSPLSAWLREVSEAPTFAVGPHGLLGGPDDAAGHPDDDPDDPDDDDLGGARHAVERRKAGSTRETIDVGFDPDVRVADGSVVAAGPGWTLRGVHTPGHTSNHLSVALDEEHALFTGDHVMGWSTTIVSPPDGDMTEYIESLRRVAGRRDAVLWPTHGAPITDPQPFLAAYLAHRLEREAQVLHAVRSGVEHISTMVELLYEGVDVKLHKAARRSVLAHLVKLVNDGVVVADGGIGGSGRPSLASTFRPV